MKVTSQAFQHEDEIPSKYTVDGENISPPLNIEGIPSEAKSLVLIMEDPDVPKAIRPDGLWNHWVIFNIPPVTGEIPEGANPPGKLGKNTKGALNYIGPAPPDKQHRYFFKLLALDIELDLPEGATRIEIEKAIEGHVIDKAELMGVYERKS